MFTMIGERAENVYLGLVVALAGSFVWGYWRVRLEPRNTDEFRQAVRLYDTDPAESQRHTHEIFAKDE